MLRLRSTITSLVDLLSEHDVDCIEACPLGTDTWTHNGHGL